MLQLKYGQGVLKLHNYCDVKEHWIKEQPNKETKKHKTVTLWFEGLCPSMFPRQLWIQKSMKDLFELCFSLIKGTGL